MVHTLAPFLLLTQRKQPDFCSDVDQISQSVKAGLELQYEPESFICFSNVDLCHVGRGACI